MASLSSLWNLHFQRGRLLARSGKWTEAEKCFQLAATGADNAEVYYHLGNAQFRLEKYELALASTETAISLAPGHADWHIRAGSLHERAKRFDLAVLAYERALVASPGNPDSQKRLSRARSRATTPVGAAKPLGQPSHKTSLGLESVDAQDRMIISSNLVWRKIALLDDRLESEPANPIWHFQRGLIDLELGRYEEAVKGFVQASRLDPSDAGVLFHLGWALRKAEKPAESEIAFDRALLATDDSTIRDRGAGAYFHANRNWGAATELYDDAVRQKPLHSDLRYRSALAYERQSNWVQAEERYFEALVFEPESPARHFKYGLALERQGKFDAAADAYAVAVRLSTTPKPVWIYRHGFVLQAAGRTDESIAVFVSMFPEDETAPSGRDGSRPALTPYESVLQNRHLEFLLVKHDPSLLAKSGRRFLLDGQYGYAIRALDAAVHQDGSQKSEWYFWLGMAHLALGDKAAALEAFLATSVFRVALDIGNHGYFTKKSQRENMEYVEFTETLRLDANIVLFESYHGSRIDCNPAAIYRELRADPRYATMRFAWVFNAGTRIPADVLADPRVLLVPRGTTLFRKYLATAKYLVSNVSFPYYFVRRAGQKYLNTWHGTPLKALGKDITSGFMQHGNVSRNLLQTTHLLAPNEHTQDSLVVRYETDGLFTGKIARLGTPRIDRMLDTDPLVRARVFKSLGLLDDGRPVVFYAPTWRGTTGAKHFDAEKLTADLEALATNESHFVFRAHHLTESLIKNLELDVTLVPAEVDTYEVLGITDVLVTDYSSIFFDFLPSQKPIVFYAYDLEEYVAERGLYFALEDMPGEIARTIGELQSAIGRAIDSGVQDQGKHQEAITRFAPAEQGLASRRTIDFFFEESDEYLVESSTDSRSIVLFRLDFAPGPVTEEYLAFLEFLDPLRHRVVVQFDRSSVQPFPERVANLARLPEHVQRIVRAGSHIVSLEERWILNQYKVNKRWPSAEQEATASKGYAREFRRIFGSAEFATATQLDALDAFGCALIGSPASGIDFRTLGLAIPVGETSGLSQEELTASQAVFGWFDHIIESPNALEGTMPVD